LNEYRRFMIFIDGGYLRNGLKISSMKPEWDCQRFCTEINKRLIRDRMPFLGEHVRTYYYDANFDYDMIKEKEKKLEKYENNRLLFDEIDRLRRHEVKLGYLADSDPPRQKGVDGLMTLDLLTKGLDNHYDVAIVVCGDRDFHPIIKSVKDRTGKNIFGVIFRDTLVSNDLIKEFDDILVIDPDNESMIKSLGLRKIE